MARFQSPEIWSFNSRTRHDGRAPLQSLLPEMLRLSVFFLGNSWPGTQQRGHTSPKSPPWSDVHHHQHQTQIPSAERCMLKILECLQRNFTLASASLWSKSGGMIQACKEREKVSRNYDCVASVLFHPTENSIVISPWPPPNPSNHSHQCPWTGWTALAH